MESVEKVYPTIEELSTVNNNQPCPECAACFNSESNLNLHLVKTHKKSHLLQPGNNNKIFHCPIESCTYNNGAHFKKMKLLKQHYLKVHSERSHTCGFCKKGFPTVAARNRHSEYCNVVFYCCDCDVFYGCYETLKTHSRRKKHNILDKGAYKASPNPVIKSHRSDESLSNKPRVLLPKPSSSAGMIIITDTSDQSCQTEKSNLNSQQTQTLGCRMPQFTVETQTIGDFCIRKPESLVRKTAKTQTVVSDPKTAACNTSLSLDELELNVMSKVERSSSATQTTLFKDPEQMYSSVTIHTDTSDLLKETLDTNFFNTETQTDFIFNDELFKDIEDCTNMWTQTCEDLLLGEIGLNDTHTQTVFDDLLKSVESQTVMSQSRMVSLSCKDMTHMETQTDSHFKQMLEEINA